MRKYQTKQQKIEEAIELQKEERRKSLDMMYRKGRISKEEYEKKRKNDIINI